MMDMGEERVVLNHNKIKPLTGLTIFTTSLCNLKCTYCYIEKCQEPLHELDKIVEKNHKNLDYVNMIKNDFSDEDKNNISSIELWGGEPLLFMERFTDTLDEYFKVLPKLNTFFFSTNMTIPNSVEKIQNLITKLIENGKKYNKKIKLHIQVSIDGPEEICDANRGKGTTEKVLNNFYKLINVDFDTTWLDLTSATKPTLSRDTFEYFLSEENIRYYYNFFNEKMYKVWKSTNSKIHFSISVPNYAEPYQYTQEDGLKLAKIFKLFQKVSHDHTMEGYKNRCLIPYVEKFNAHIPLDNFVDERYKNTIFYTCGGGCSHLFTACSLLPDNRYAVCHRGFFNDYKPYDDVDVHNFEEDSSILNKAHVTPDKRFTFSKEDFLKVREAMSASYYYANKGKNINIKNMIQLYAYSGLVDEKYKDDKEALMATIIMSSTLSCIYNNITTTGSMFTNPLSTIKLFCNGAMDVIIDELKIMKGI